MIFVLGVFVPRLSISWNVSSHMFLSISSFVFPSLPVRPPLLLFCSSVGCSWCGGFTMMLWLSIFSFSFCVALVCPGRFSGVNQRLGVG